MRIIWIQASLLLICSLAWAESIDLAKIIQIESSGNPLAYNKRSKARGLCQITPIVLEDYNYYGRVIPGYEPITASMLFNPEVNKRIASWYLEERIPQMLRHFKKPVSVENVLIAYNAGISYVVNGKSLPMETRKYIERYYHGTS